MSNLDRLPCHRFGHGFGKKTVLAVATLFVLSGCASVNFDQFVAKTNEQAAIFTQGNLSLARTKDQRAEMDSVANEILSKPIGQNDAVRLGLVNSPALQAMLAQNWAAAAGAAQTGRIANPVFTFERLRFASELELGRLLSFGLLDLLTLPQRYKMAERQIAQQQLRLTSNVIDQVTQVRQAWVKAVAAQQSFVYAKQVNDAAQASSELARRLQAAGNFSKLQRARQQVFYVDAATQWATAQHASTSTREELTRLLGLTESQAAVLVLPDRLPELPSSPRSPDEVSKLASKGRLDIQLAQAELDAQSKAQGLNLLTSLIDIELGVRRDTVFDNVEETSTPKRGYEVSLRLPLFDWGGNQRDAMNAQTLAAANRLEATVRTAGSNLRENYSAYRTAFDISKHYRDEVVPLRKTISEENLLRYNGMLIGVFELLADTRDQVSSVMAAIAAEQQFWLADAALQAAIVGKPTIATVGAMASGGGGDAGH
jgi:outer membrane protein TolC